MPTGYTCILEDNPDTTLKEYILRCARGMGPCIMQREDSIDTPPKLEEIGSYHADSLKRAHKGMDSLQTKTDEEWEQEFEEWKLEELESTLDCLKEIEQHRKTYENMRRKVQAWQPPTADHQGLKNFMISQIDECIKYDHRDYYREELNKLNTMTLKEWKKDYITRLNRDVEYHTKYYKEEVERVEYRNKWKQELLDALDKM